MNLIISLISSVQVLGTTAGDASLGYVAPRGPGGSVNNYTFTKPGTIEKFDRL